MNNIIVNGTIRDFDYSHTMMGSDIQFEKANIVCLNSNGKESVLNIKFKKYANNSYKEGDVISFIGNLRSYSEQINGKNKVSIYIYTYLDAPTEQIDSGNIVDIDGRICSIEPLRELNNGKQNIHFILANNIITADRKINSYIPCIAWGKLAIALSKLSVGTQLHVTKGELRSRDFVKHLPTGEDEFRVCHELYVQEFELIEETKQEN